jgi:hypothetical protein
MARDRGHSEASHPLPQSTENRLCSSPRKTCSAASVPCQPLVARADLGLNAGGMTVARGQSDRPGPPRGRPAPLRMQTSIGQTPSTDRHRLGAESGMSGFETGNGQRGHNHLRTPLQTFRANVGVSGRELVSLGCFPRPIEPIDFPVVRPITDRPSASLGKAAGL